VSFTANLTRGPSRLKTVDGSVGRGFNINIVAAIRPTVA
jgi:hypothetical protein